ARRAAAQLDHPIRRRRADFRQPCGRADAVAPLRGRGPVRLIAVACTLPLQARRLSRRDLAPLRSRRLAACEQPFAFPSDRPPIAAAGRRRLAGERNSYRVAGRFSVAPAPTPTPPHSRVEVL